MKGLPEFKLNPNESWDMPTSCDNRIQQEFYDYKKCSAKESAKLMRDALKSVQNSSCYSSLVHAEKIKLRSFLKATF